MDSLWEFLPAGRRSQAAATSKMSHVGGRPKAFPARQVLTNGRHRTAAGTDSRGGRPACGNSVVGSPQKRRCPMKTAPFEFEVESLMFDVDFDVDKLSRKDNLSVSFADSSPMRRAGRTALRIALFTGFRRAALSGRPLRKAPIGAIFTNRKSPKAMLSL